MPDVRTVIQRFRNLLGRCAFVRWAYGHYHASGVLIHLAILHLSRRHRRGTVLYFCTASFRQGTSSRLRAVNVASALRRREWRALAVHPMCTLAQRRRMIRWLRPDVIVLQKSAHPLNRPALYPGHQLIFDLDDADFNDPSFRDGVVDCCRGCQAVIAGSRYVADFCGQYNANVSIVWTGTHLPSKYPSPAPSQRGPVVAWAHSSPMNAPHEARFLVDVLGRLAARKVEFEFWLYGFNGSPDITSYVEKLRQGGIRVRTHSLMPFKEYIRTLQKVAVGLQPLCAESPYSQGKSFGKILGYLSAGVPVVAADRADHPLFFRHGQNGMLAQTPEQWTAAIEQLLGDPAMRDRLSRAAWADFHAQLGVDRAAEKIETILLSIFAPGRNEKPIRTGSL